MDGQALGLKLGQPTSDHAPIEAGREGQLTTDQARVLPQR